MDMPQRILNTIRAYPGLHLRELARQMDTSVTLIEYHVPGLEAAGHVRRVEEDGVHRLYASNQQLDEQLIACLRDSKRLQITLVLLQEDAMRHGDLAAATGLGKSTLSFHLKRLERAGVATRDERGQILLADPAGVRAVLATHRPTPDLVDRFGDMWGQLYG